MQKSPFFTIITASLNNKASIRQVIESIKNQSFQDFEHIIIDGGSNDGTLNIIREYENRYNLNYISEPDQGIADALNKGLLRAQGQFILVIQADDQLLHTNVLRSLHGVISKSQEDIHRFQVLYDKNDSKNWAGPITRLKWWNRFRNIFPHQGVLVQRTLFDQIGFFNTEYTICMDYDFFYRALIADASIRSYNMPIALVARGGISSNEHFLNKRLSEEFKIQGRNENNPLWRILQLVFWVLYKPYKRFLASK